MQWLSPGGIVVMGILLLSAAADVLFILVVYRFFIRFFGSTRTSMKIISFVLALGLLVPFIVALHRLALLFMAHRIAYLWLLIMILICAGFAGVLPRLSRKA
jgi:hypothetical protein